MYLYYFERVLQQAANDPNLRLPYWDYATDPKLPPALRATTYVNENGQRVPNPLRVEQPAPALNNGRAGFASAITSTTGAMRATSRSVFETRMEATPHGAVHCAIPEGGCPNGYMGTPASAASDPIFYFHHANIDRLYECWLQVDQNGRLPTDPAILNRTYSFIDNNGARRERRVRDMLTTSALHYSYTSGAGCPEPTVAAAAAAPLARTALSTQSAQTTQATELSAAGPTQLKAGVTKVTLGGGAPAPSGGAAPTARSVAPLSTASQPATQSAILTIEGVKAARVPGVVYTVSLANDKGASVEVGVLSFFGFDPKAGSGPKAGSASKKHAHATNKGKDYNFDATDAVNQLGLTTTNDPILVFTPSTGLTDSTVAVASKAIPPNARVSFAAATLRLE